MCTVVLYSAATNLRFCSKELGVHLNGDEAMALGSAFYAANLSTAFRVRRVGMTDMCPFAIGVRFTDLEKPEGMISDMVLVSCLLTLACRQTLRRSGPNVPRSSRRTTSSTLAKWLHFSTTATSRSPSIMIQKTASLLVQSTSIVLFFCRC